MKFVQKEKMICSQCSLSVSFSFGGRAAGGRARGSRAGRTRATARLDVGGGALVFTGARGAVRRGALAVGALFLDRRARARRRATATRAIAPPARLGARARAAARSGARARAAAAFAVARARATARIAPHRHVLHELNAFALQLFALQLIQRALHFRSRLEVAHATHWRAILLL